MAEQSANIAELQQKLRQKEREIYSIQRIGKALSSTLNLNELLALIMQEITILIGADRSTLFLVDQERGEIWSKIALKAEVKEIRLPVGKGISGHVAATGETINIPDAYHDDRFDPGTDKRTGYRTRSILCMPIWEPLSPEHDRKVLGVIQVLNKTDGVFTREDEDLLEALSSQVAISIANSRLYQQLEKKLREIDLLYEFEQLLSAIYELQEMLRELLKRTVKHLKAHEVIAILPGESVYSFYGYGPGDNEVREQTPSISLGLLSFIQNPSADQIASVWKEIATIIQADPEKTPEQNSLLIAPLDLLSDRKGLLLAIGVSVGQQQRFEDERRLVELVAQKIQRADELQALRSQLVQRERLSAIGQLMSAVVHDIRSPMNTVQGFVELMADESTNSDERSEYSSIIRDEIRALTVMVTEILDFAKGKTSILPRKSSVKNLLKRFQPRLEQMCGKYNTELHIDQQSNQLLYIDEEKLLRVFYNITKNAIEAMENGGRLSIKISDTDDGVVFDFSDNGPGIPREIQDRLFDSFVTSGKVGGTGLGLAIVKKIIEEHHGEVEIDSIIGEGATFRITLPVYKKQTGEDA